MDKTIKPASTRELVPLGKLRVSPTAQREFIQTWGDHLASIFNIDLMRTPSVSFRDGQYWVIDGQHSVYACKQWAKREFGQEWAQWTVECDVYDKLSEQQEAEIFLALNDRRSVNAFDKFRVGVTAGLPVPVGISDTVAGIGLRIDQSKKPGSLSAVGALTDVYKDARSAGLSQVLRVINNSWAGMGIEADAIRGTALFMKRYAGRFDEDRLVKKLSSIAGVKALRQRAFTIRESHGATVAAATAAAITDLYNSGARGMQSLGSWWKDPS